MPRGVLFNIWTISIVGLAQSYKVFYGDGSLAQGWPAESAWLSYDELWQLNIGVLNSSCAPTYGENNSPAEIESIRRFIPQASSYANVPPSLFFSMMMQESDGCVRVGSTAAAVTNPGLMQSNNGEGNCAGVRPCSPDTIKLMLMDGAGQGRDFGLKQALEPYNRQQSPEKYYRAARAYNSGPLGIVPLRLEEGGATRCYASDIANRLLGWNRRADTACMFDRVRLANNASLPSATSYRAPPFSSLAPGTSNSCRQYYLVQSGDTCYKVADRWNLTFSQLRISNPSLDEDCTNLWRDYYYCIDK